MNKKLNGFEVYFEIERLLKSGQPGAVIRLGDGEGALIGFPDITTSSHCDNFMKNGLVVKISLTKLKCGWANKFATQ